MRSYQLFDLVDRRHRRKGAAARSLRRRTARFAVGCGAFFLLALFAGLVGISLTYSSLVDGLPSVDLLPEMLHPVDGSLMQPTRLYDRSGQQLLYTLENPGISRHYLVIDANQPDHFSPELIRAVIGMLDQSFWQGPGFRLRSLTSQQPATIAERLVDALLLWQEPAGLRRSLRMRILAAQAANRFGRVQVLEWYLNSANFGHLAFGADSAARLYLNKSAANLTLPEAALLVAAIQAPALNALDAPSAAVERQRAVLDVLAERGVISEQEHRQAAQASLALARPMGETVSPALAFSRLVVDGLSGRFGRERLERGGIRIITSLDFALQQELTCLARTQISRLVGEAEPVTLPDGSPCQSARLLPTLPPGTGTLPDGTAASAVVMDPRSGQVLALLGDTSVSRESGSLTLRQPGSTLTPLVAIAAFARGTGPASLVWDIPTGLGDGQEGLPDPGGGYQGPVRMRLAIANDYLVPIARLLEQIGPANVWRLAASLGLNGLDGETSADLIYRGGQVSPLDVAHTYTIFAGQGQRIGQRYTQQGSLRPVMVLYVETTGGQTLWDARQPEAQAAVSPQLAYLVHHVLSDATARWPSLGFPNALEIGRPAGAKIGQVLGGEQVWTVGYTPQRVAVFWLGLPPDSTGVETLEPRAVSGMWHAFMQYSNRDLPVTDWPEPPGISRVDVCSPSGQLPTSTCPEIVSEVFLNGNEPTTGDSLYRRFQINRETGRLATVFTPPELIEEQTFLVVPPEAGQWARAAGLPVPPVAYDAIQPTAPDDSLRIDTPQMYAFVRGSVDILGTAAGEDFRFYQLQVGQGLNPQSWLKVGPDGTTAVVEGVLASWDTGGLEGLYAVRLQVVRADQSIETATIQVTVDNTAPLARIIYPGPNQELSAQETVFQVEASDAIGVQSVVWKLDGKTIGETTQPPYAITWKPARGAHTLEVLVYDQAGNEGTSGPVNFLVK